MQEQKERVRQTRLSCFDVLKKVKGDFILCELMDEISGQERASALLAQFIAFHEHIYATGKMAMVACVKHEDNIAVLKEVIENLKTDIAKYDSELNFLRNAG